MFQAIAAVAAGAQKDYFECPTVAAYSQRCSADPYAAAADAASWKDYSAGLSTSVAAAAAAAAAACQKYYFAAQLAGSVALCFAVAPLAALLAILVVVESMFVADE